MEPRLNPFRKGLVLLLMLCMGAYAYAQKITVTGTVTDADSGEPLISATVQEKGSTNGAITDFDGNYSIEVSGEGAVLVFSYTGYTSREETVGTRRIVNVKMVAGEELQEVVVVGYGTVRKDDATGAVLALSDKDFNQGVITSPDQMIQGRASGVQVTPATGEPGAGANIRIRGAGSIRAGNNPLIVLDGVPLDGRDISAGADVGAGSQSARNPLNFINPNDIASINILKDASATAIYGSRGANGVIIITTKQGSRKRPELSFSAATTVSSMPAERRYDLLDPATFRANTSPNVQYGGEADAFDEILRTGLTQVYNLTYGGASETGRYRFSLGATDQEGIIKNTGLKTYNGTVNISQDFFEGRLKVDGKLIGSMVRDEATALSDNVGAEGDLIISALRWNPTRNFRDANGNLVQPSDNERNPLAFLEYYGDNTETSRIFGNISATFNITEGLDYKYNYGVDRSESVRRIGVSRLLNANFAIGSGGVANVQNIQASTELHEHTLNYVRKLSDKVGMNALVGYSYQRFERRGGNQRATNFLIDDQNLYVNNLNYASAFPANQNNSFTDPDDELQSFFGRVNFDINDKFLLTATVRADGSSRFGEGNRYGVFPSAAFAWQLYKEEFIPDAFDDLKLRLGWGVTGNQEFPSGSAQTQYRPLADGSGITQTTIGNPDLRWESTSQYNVGVDFGFLGYRLTGSIDWYFRQTTDLLFRVRAAQPAPDVFIWRNLDGITVDNTGIDFNLDYFIVSKEDFSWEAGINMSYLSNAVRNVSSVFPDGIQTGAINGQGLSNQLGQLIFDDEQLYAFYLPVFEGFDENGNAIYADLNGDGENTASGIVGPGNGDRTFVGNPNPDFLLGFRTAVTYKNFDASLYAYGAFGHQVFDNTALALFNQAALNGGANVTEDVLTRGQSGGDSPVPSDLFLQDADFLRIATLTLGYNFPVNNNKYLRGARVFVTGQNLFVFTGYTGFDPEVNSNKQINGVPSFGMDYSAYPRARSFTLGVNLNF